jgi:hypothetical protein
VSMTVARPSRKNSICPGICLRSPEKLLMKSFNPTRRGGDPRLAVRLLRESGQT